jgi:hypothetical protein
MKILRLASIALAAAVVAGPASAASCYELWYKRNAMYDAKGFCFKTEKGQLVFNNDDCWTSHPKFSSSQWKKINAIRKQEKAMGCTAADVDIGG